MIDDCISDFTLDGYVAALELAQMKYRFVRYPKIDFSEPFVIWRHDCDHSLNRALRFAEIEHDRGIRSTYFINPHCHYYNLLEREQAEIIARIIGMGHDVGLHFDALFHEIASEDQLDKLVAQEAAWIGEWFGVDVVAFSFHSPTRFCLTCEMDSYGGLVNCYASRFKSQIAYCSDSNGYWRFHRLHDVLAAAEFRYLQVLTHPEHWQDRPMYPRERVFRSIYGRAAAILDRYDVVLEQHSRFNIAGGPDGLAFVKQIIPEKYRLLNYLWNSGEFQALFIELWRLHEGQINKLCKAMLRKEWRVAASEVNTFFEDSGAAINGWRLFKVVFEQSLQTAAGIEEARYKEWVALRNRLVHGHSSASRQQMEEGCVFLCHVIGALMSWGKTQSMNYDGISYLCAIGIPTYKTVDGHLTDLLEEVFDEIPSVPEKRWMQFKAEMEKVDTEDTAE